MIACDGRLAAEVEAQAMRTDLRNLQQHGDAFGAILRNGKADLGAVYLSTAMPLHPLGMLGDVFGAQAAAECVAIVTVHAEPTVDDHAVFLGEGQSGTQRTFLAE